MTVSPDKLVKHAQVLATDLIKRRWPNRHKGVPIVNFKECVDGLVEMGAIEQETIEMFGKKVSLVHWLIDHYQAKKEKNYESGNLFYKSSAWRKLRFSVLKESNGKCSCCGMSAKDGVILHVDHIKPRSQYPELALDSNNLQVLCDQCNLGKSDSESVDFR